MLHAEFRDPLLVAVYDAEFPWSYRDDFFLSIVEEPAERPRPAAGEAALWNDVTEDRPGVVSFFQYYRFADGGELLSTGTLAFRGEHDLRASLRDAGFTVERIYGGWHREPVGSGDGEFLVVAHT
ncbi:hypothetical protein ABZW10_03420 [Kitasatospora sp. NPDC004723]|uniref:hypothetical protein n=1 Tax=Kitasatospora sp. NPDC004723 TaxID=3154288 RepID=UPI0033B2C461